MDGFRVQGKKKKIEKEANLLLIKAMAVDNSIEEKPEEKKTDPSKDEEPEKKRRKLMYEGKF